MRDASLSTSHHPDDARLPFRVNFDVNPVHPSETPPSSRLIARSDEKVDGNHDDNPLERIAKPKRPIA